MLIAALLCPLATQASGTQIDLSADAQYTAPNDLARATVFVEMQDANPAELAKRVNNALGAILGIATKFNGVKSRTGDTQTSPIYGKSNRLESWRMRAEIDLESRDIPKLSELLGRLKDYAMVGDIQLSSAPETRRQAEDEAMREALDTFQSRAKKISDQLGKPYRITQLSVQTGGLRPPRMPMMMRAAMPESAPMPIAAGESTVTVTVSGKIELGN
jgi:predicted secreted protein